MPLSTCHYLVEQLCTVKPYPAIHHFPLAGELRKHLYIEGLSRSDRQPLDESDTFVRIQRERFIVRPAASHPISQRRSCSGIPRSGRDFPVKIPGAVLTRFSAQRLEELDGHSVGMPPRPAKQPRRLSILLINSPRRRQCTVVPDAHRLGDRGGPGRQHRDGTAPVALQEGADGRAGRLLGVIRIA